MELKQIAERFRLNGNVEKLEQITMGHINVTHKVFCDGANDYILQKINTNIFKNPYQLIENIYAVTSFLGDKIAISGGDRFREAMTLVETKDGGYLLREGDDYYRCYICVPRATCYNSAVKPGLFRNSAAAFGRFQMLLSDFPAEKLHETIPNFHNTPSRFRDFVSAVKRNEAGRKGTCKDEIDFFLSRESFCPLITDLLSSGEMPMRVTHNDTKLNNVMMDDSTLAGICVIDLDTVMPGSALYDFGDSIRFGASTAAEDEKDLSKVECSMALFEEYTEGFLSEAGKTLTKKELELLPEGAIMMTLECGMRFLADYLNGDVYFSLHYEGQNLDRARTQIKLVKDMESKLLQMKEIVKKHC